MSDHQKKLDQEYLINKDPAIGNKLGMKDKGESRDHFRTRKFKYNKVVYTPLTQYSEMMNNIVPIENINHPCIKDQRIM